jgi:hypothetical protein
MFTTIEQFIKDNKDDLSNLKLKLVRLTNFDNETVTIFKNEFKNRYD